MSRSLVLLLVLVLVLVQTAVGFMCQELFLCQFNSSALQDVHYRYSYVYNKVEFIRFDSHVGSFVGLNSFGQKLAANWNNGSDWLNVMKKPDGQMDREALWLNGANMAVCRFTLGSGETISCLVEHLSLKEPLSIDWTPPPGRPMPESEKIKIAFGVLGLIVGLVLFLTGFIYYKKKAGALPPILSMN
ncbi:HLA class II histocompatibility antigen, DR beta 5 chain-like [Poeciliopsis prolifica]|uniref:HLA class II histocompatibility antigen, DR beta 5 chain-like n=1 Tax=Poeciliopsis prolifica TaxID=188132 RepID=UPI0024144527|nr:HLA class II histocompatibility antigen, DR beta 5 chain-like [Poeciliopsis prolifica]